MENQNKEIYIPLSVMQTETNIEHSQNMSCLFEAKHTKFHQKISSINWDIITFYSIHQMLYQKISQFELNFWPFEGSLIKPIRMRKYLRFQYNAHAIFYTIHRGLILPNLSHRRFVLFLWIILHSPCPKMEWKNRRQGCARPWSHQQITPLCAHADDFSPSA